MNIKGATAKQTVRLGFGQKSNLTLVGAVAFLMSRFSLLRHIYYLRDCVDSSGDNADNFNHVV
jgi:hypothetical protein